MLLGILIGDREAADKKLLSNRSPRFVEELPAYTEQLLANRIVSKPHYYEATRIQDFYARLHLRKRSNGVDLKLLSELSDLSVCES